LTDANGQVQWSASRHPVSDMYPTAAWKTGEVIPDWYEIPVTESLLPGRYLLELGLFPPFSVQGLDYADGQMWMPVSEIDVGLSDARPKIPRLLAVVAPAQENDGGWRLLGYDMPKQAPPTGRTVLKLYWRALRALPDYEIGTRVTSDDGGGEWQWQEPGNGIYPTSRWEANKTVVTAHMLAMPAATGQATVQVAMREASSDGRRVTFYPGWLRSRSIELALPALTVAGRPPADPGTFNYGDEILMARVAFEQKTLAPGAPLELAIEWQCMQTMAVDYTLFVQLLAPDGTLKGQIDVWPRDGTHPTSAWQEGETVLDRYIVYADQDAPPGEYKMAVGWYLLETMQRLPVLDSEGNAVDDKVMLTGVRVIE
jgi:hypothetical protein